jgi:hypothetical protein
MPRYRYTNTAVAVPLVSPLGTLWGTPIIPTGSRCVFLADPSGGRWVLDEFPQSVKSLGKLALSDARHYGLTIPLANVSKP